MTARHDRTNAWPWTDLLTARVATSPSALAVIDTGTGEDVLDGGGAADRLTYAELDDLVDDLARRLVACGIGPGDHVGTVLDTSLHFVTVIHALDRLGAVLVPLNVRLTPNELASQCARIDIDLLLCDNATVATARRTVDLLVGRPGGAVTPGVMSVAESPVGITPTLWEVAETQSLPTVDRSPSDPRLVLFTSGTTGDPKAVTLTTWNLVASAISSGFRLGIDTDDRWLCVLPMYHMGGLAPVVRSTLYGTAVVLQPEFDAGTTAAAAHAHDVTCVSFVPTMLHRIFEADETLPDSLRFVLLGGGPVEQSLIETADRRDVPVCPTYGMTETASQIATALPQEAVDHEGTVGKPLFGTEVTIVDDDDRPVERGDAGEIVVSGPTVTPGYVDAEATDDAFGPYGFHTGDVGHRDREGRLWVSGRREDRIITGGENVDPLEVAAVLRDCEGVSAAAVVGIEDEEWGERVGALVVPERGSSVDIADILYHCRGTLARYKQPRTVRLVDQLPRTPSGTVDRELARELLRELS